MPRVKLGTEYKVQLRRRLEAEGVWKKAKAFREGVRVHMMRDYPEMDRMDVSDHAWHSMAREFPPQGLDSTIDNMTLAPETCTDREQGELTPLERKEVAEKSIEAAAAGADGPVDRPTIFTVKFLQAARRYSPDGGYQKDLEADVEWVYQNLATPFVDIDVKTIPSCGAVGLLEYAKNDRPGFLEKFKVKTLSARVRFDQAGGFASGDEEGDMTIGEALHFLEDAVSVTGERAVG